VHSVEGQKAARLLFSIHIKCAAILKVKWYFDVKRAKGNVLSFELPCPPVQPDSAHHFNGVDIQDKDSANYPTILKTNCWYMRIFFWCLD
jgi:hypothetical protein